MPGLLKIGLVALLLGIPSLALVLRTRARLRQGRWPTLGPRDVPDFDPEDEYHDAGYED